MVWLNGSGARLAVRFASSIALLYGLEAARHIFYLCPSATPIFSLLVPILVAVRTGLLSNLRLAFRGLELD